MCDRLPKYTREDKRCKNDKLNIVDCYTMNCGPCKKMIPDILDLRDENKDVNFWGCDGDGGKEAEKFMSDWEIERYPTLVFIKDKKVIFKMEKTQKKEDIQKTINAILKSRD
jgi:thiol-disulfide isomerase/thioredoxin